MHERETTKTITKTFPSRARTFGLTIHNASIKANPWDQFQTLFTVGLKRTKWQNSTFTGRVGGFGPISRKSKTHRINRFFLVCKIAMFLFSPLSKTNMSSNKFLIFFCKTNFNWQQERRMCGTHFYAKRETLFEGVAIFEKKTFQNRRATCWGYLLKMLLLFSKRQCYL